MVSSSRRKLLFAFLCAVGSAAILASSAETEVIAIKGGTLYTVTRGIVEGGVLLIRGGRIEAAGKSIAIPKEARVIEASGAAIFPGFIDAFTNLGANEVMFGGDFDEATSPITPQLRITESINPENEFIPMARKTGTTAALVAPGTGNLLSGQSAFVRLSGTTVADMIVKFPVAVHANLGEAPKRRYGQKGQYPSTRMGEAALLRQTLTEAREYFAAAARYAEKKDDYEKTGVKADLPTRPNTNLKYEALIPVIQGQLPLVVAAERMDDILTALRIADEFGLRIIFSGGADAWKVKDRLAKAKIPVLLRPAAAAHLTMETRGALPDSAALLRKAGIKIAFQTGETENLGGLIDQARSAVAHGLSQEEAIKALTISPAEIFGAADELGSLEKGKWADVVIFDGNPFLAPARVRMTIIGGRVIAEEN